MTDMMPQAVNPNRQLGYYQRFPAWKSTVIPAAFALAFLTTLCFCHMPIAAILVIACIGLLIARSAIKNARGSWECRIGEGTFSWHNPGTDWSTIQTAELSQVLVVNFPNQERVKEYELILENGRHLALDWWLIEFSSFKAAILREKPGVVFQSRDGTRCYQCGADLRVRRDRCSACGTAIPDARKNIGDEPRAS